MNVALRTLCLSWPREVTAPQLEASMRLLASHGGTPLVAQAIGQGARVEHRITVHEGAAASLTTQLRSAVSGLGIESVGVEEPLPTFDRAISLRLSTGRRPLRTEQLEVTTRALQVALAAVGKGEALLLEWVLTAPLVPSAVPSKIDHLHDERLALALLKAPFGAAPAADADTRSALRYKRGVHGWKAIGRIAVRGDSAARQKQLIRGVLQALRTVEAPGVQITGRSIRPTLIGTTRGCARIRINSEEFAGLVAWPLGLTADLPIARQTSRRLPAPAALSRVGRAIGESTWPGSDRPLAISAEDSLRHLHVLGPTGVGKSTLLLHLIEQDMRAGRGLVVIEPKGDLIQDVLARVPDNRISDVVLLDPTDTAAVVGFNPLRASVGLSPDLVADQLLGTFHALYERFWGPRTSDILHAGFLTLARTPDTTLSALPLLLTNQAFRRRIVGRLHDPLGLTPFWAGYEAWSEAERTAAIAPVLNKLRPFLMRPALRRVIGQADPAFRIHDVFTQRKILLVNLQKGVLGPEAAQLLGALVLSGIWQQAQTRSQFPTEKRHPVFVFIDEFQDYLALPTDLAEALAQSRSLGLGLVMAHQHLGQLRPEMKAAVLSNARSRICFQLAADDAKTMAGTSTILAADDFTSIEAFQFYAQLMTAGAVQPWCSGRSLPPSKPTSDPQIVRATSRELYATDVRTIDADLERLVASPEKRTQPPSNEDGEAPSAARDRPQDLGPKRRRTGGPT